jgi:hypothetical protein
MPFRNASIGPTPSDQIDPPFRSTFKNMTALGKKNHGTPPVAALKPKSRPDHTSQLTTLRRNAMTRSSNGRSSNPP